MGGGAGSGGYAKVNLEGGLFYNPGPTVFAQPAGNLGIYIDIFGGTLKLDNADNGGLTWDIGALMGIANSDFRSYGVTATFDNLLFTDDEAAHTLITAVDMSFTGDINQDEYVNDLDLNLLLSDYAGGPGVAAGIAPYNSADLATLLANSGSSNNLAADMPVPEPTSALLLLGLFGIVPIVRHRQ